jgi:5'-nucleotidase
VPFILVTNDDGVDSPALPPLVRALARLAPVRAVAPAGERSWIGKAITRHEEVAVEEVERSGVRMHAASGYPADCAQLGVHALFGERPEMVVSGINVGFNHGLAFLLSSGTVGAAAEGWIAGLPAIALSTGDLHDHPRWAKEAWSGRAAPMWERLAELAASVVEDVREAGYPEEVDVLSVNFPHTADVRTPRRVTRLARVGYDRLFRPGEHPGTWRHDFGGDFRTVGPLEGTDLEGARHELVTITPVRLAHTAEIPAGIRRRLER